MKETEPAGLDLVRKNKKGQDVYRSYQYGIDFPITVKMAEARFKYKSSFQYKTSDILDNFRYQLEIDEADLSEMHDNSLKDLESLPEDKLEECELEIEENILRTYPELNYAYIIFKYVMDLWNQGKWDPEWWNKVD
tara:strand:- start:10186 stop:10593 length:408 start_codon:yes stop_codon:yes gene_type:complete